MKTHDFCKIFKMNRNLLRFYRDIHIITPSRDTNGYFSYDRKDFASLHFALREQMNHEKTLNQLSKQINTSSGSDEIKNQILTAQQSLDEIEKQIILLEEKKKSLQHLINYRKDLLKTMNTPIEVEHVSALFYVSYDSDFALEDIHSMLSTNKNFNGIGFSLHQLKQNTIQTDFIVGILEDYITKDEISSYMHCTYIPPGKALRFTTVIHDLHQISSSLFKPVVEYASTHHYELYPYVTSIILDVHQNPEEYLILFRFMIIE